MDPNLRAELIKHDLGHRYEEFKNMGIESFKDMAHVRQRELSEDLLFKYTELRKFEALRKTCINKVNEQQIFHEQEPLTEVRPQKVENIITETGYRIKSEPPYEYIPEPITISSVKVKEANLYSEIGVELANGLKPLYEYYLSKKRVPSTSGQVTQEEIGKVSCKNKMYKEVKAEVIKHDLGHKIKYFNKLGIITFKQMARVREKVLTEDLFFNYSEKRYFDQLRVTCKLKLKEQKKKQSERIEVTMIPGSEVADKTASKPPLSLVPISTHSSSIPSLKSEITQPHLKVGNSLAPCQASPKDFEVFYPLDQNVTGLGLIFVNEKIKGQDNRIGAVQDEQNFTHLFEGMGLTSLVYRDKSCKEIRQEILEITMSDLSLCEMLAVAISTHGAEGDKLYGSDGTTYSLYHDVVTPFKPNSCPGLTGKPKVFFIQSCKRNEVGSRLIQTDGIERPCVTHGSDFLIAHSTVWGYKSFRHTETGSWFVTTLREIFEKYKDNHHIYDILTFVNQIVIRKSLEESGDSDKFIQTCQVESTLTKLMRFL